MGITVGAGSCQLELGHRHAVTFVYCTVIFLGGLSVNILGPAGPTLTKQLDASFTLIGSIFTFEGIGGICGSTLAGHVLTKYSGHHLVGGVCIMLFFLIGAVPHCSAGYQLLRTITRMKLLLAVLLGASVLIRETAGFAVLTASRHDAMWSATRHATSRVTRPALIESDTKITIKKPADAASAASVADDDGAGASGATKVTVRVRSKSERSAAAAAPTPAEVDLDDGSTTVTVKAPVKVVAPPPPPQGPALTESEKLLLAAVQKANCSQVLYALKEGANPNVRDPKGRTPLHFVAGVGLAPAATLLVHFGAQLDARDEDGLTPMHMAAGYANAQTLRVLVAAGADHTLTAKVQGTAEEVVCALGDFQLREFWKEKQEFKGRFKKKDEKLEKLKACMDVLEDPATVREEADWDEMMTETMQAIGGLSDSNVL